MSEDVKQLCNLYIDETIREVLELGKHISNACEAALQEYENSKLLCEFLQNHGFIIERNVGKLPTSFKAQYTRGIGPTIALFAEYDTIDNLGVKNQNYFSSICAIACVLGIKKVLEAGEFSGTIQVYGTPAKVVNLGKTIMMEHGVFDKVDAIFIARASDGPTRIAGTSQNFKSYSISFKNMKKTQLMQPCFLRNSFYYFKKK